MRRNNVIGKSPNVKVVCGVLVVVGAVGGYFGVRKIQRDMALFSSPSLYIARPDGNASSNHEAWLMLDGFTDRDWTLFVNSDGDSEPSPVKGFGHIEMGALAGLEWSRDGEVIVFGLVENSGDRVKQRAIAYVFSNGTLHVPECRGTFHTTQAGEREDRSKSMSDLLDTHGGASEQYFPNDVLRQSVKKLDYETYRKLMPVR